MNQLAEYAAFVEKACLQYPIQENPKNLYDPLRYFLTLGGKRMRPILTLMSGNVFDLSKEECISAALSIEFFHNFSLIHDDIMDAAPLRRGEKTVHEKWNTNIAILSGDVLFVEAYVQLSNYSDERLPILLKRFNETAKQVCDGQQLDMDFETRNDVSVDEYIEMIRLKTSVLLGCAFEFGAILAKRNEKERQLLFNFGEKLGLAFQIQDDILDLYGNPETFGKQIGGDVLSNKKTLLLLNAKDKSPVEVEKLIHLIPSEDKIAFAKDIFERSGALEETKNKMNFYYDSAMLDLHSLGLTEFKLKPLTELAKFLLNREQ